MPSLTVMVLPGSAVPTNVGVVSLVTPLAVGEVTTGALGATVSTVNGRVTAALVLPAGSVAVALIVCAPSAKGRLELQFQLPLASTVAVQSVTTPSLTVTVLPGSPIPVIVGVLSLVVLLTVGEITLGAAGVVVSTVNARGAVVDVPPAPSVTVAVML